MSDTDLDVSSFESLEAEPRGPEEEIGEYSGEGEEEGTGTFRNPSMTSQMFVLHLLFEERHRWMTTYR